MSVEAVRWALYEAPMLLTEKSKPDTSARQVLVVLAEHADADGRNARPSVLRIKFATGLDFRTIQRALARLQRGNLIRAAGKTRFGCTNWTLALDARRPASEWAELQAEHELSKERESQARQERRRRVSGSQNPGHEPGEDEMSGTQSAGRPGRRIPASGTQDPGVRHATPPEPPGNHPEPPSGTTPGGRNAAPQTPAYRSTGHPAYSVTDQLECVGNHLSGNAENDSPRSVWVMWGVPELRQELDRRIDRGLHGIASHRDAQVIQDIQAELRARGVPHDNERGEPRPDPSELALDETNDQTPARRRRARRTRDGNRQRPPSAEDALARVIPFPLPRTDDEDALVDEAVVRLGAPCAALELQGAPR